MNNKVELSENPLFTAYGTNDFTNFCRLYDRKLQYIRVQCIKGNACLPLLEKEFRETAKVNDWDIAEETPIYFNYFICKKNYPWIEAFTTDGKVMFFSQGGNGRGMKEGKIKRYDIKSEIDKWPKPSA